MHRPGFAVEDIPLLIRRSEESECGDPRSVFSHFVGSDSPQFDAFYSQGQIELPEKGSQELQAAFSHKILRHTCNTAGIERFPDAQFDMALGIGLFMESSLIDNSIIHNVSTLKTTASDTDVPQEDTVGYSRMGIWRTSTHCAIPIGYADGIFELPFGTRQRLLPVNGKKAPYVGNICMDVCMIDVTDIDCREGDQAITLR